jgi:Fic family protein
MPKRIAEQELLQIEETILRFPDGLSLAELHEALARSVSPRTLLRRLAGLAEEHRVHRRGQGKATRYFHGALERRTAARLKAAGRFETTAGFVNIHLTPVSGSILDYVSRPLAARTPCGYRHRLLDDYLPNRTTYLSAKLRLHLHRIGKPPLGERAAGTVPLDILNRFLVGPSWASRRLEGGSRRGLDTEPMAQFGEEAVNREVQEAQIALNHEAAIELLVGGEEGQVGINRYTLLNLHAVLADNLMPDPAAPGQLRTRPVHVVGSVYMPSANARTIKELFALIIDMASAIDDPFEQAFFLTVHLPYLQPFETANKRVARLAANIPLLQGGFCPLTFMDVPERAYTAAYLGVYEMTRIELLRDVFVWAYERSCRRYVALREASAQPDRFRLKHRTALIAVIGSIVRQQKQPTPELIRQLARPLVGWPDLPRFVELAQQEFARLNDGNIARYRIRLPDYRAWARG